MRPHFVAVLLSIFAALPVAAIDQPPTVTTPEGRVLSFDPDWTPRPQAGDVPAYVKETDVDWVDDRLRRMDTGRTFNATFKYRHGDKDVTCYKGTAIRVGEKGEAAWLYDRNQLRWCCAWECEPLTEPTADNPTGWTPYLNHSDRRFGLLNTPTPKGEMVFSTGLGSEWSNANGEWDPIVPQTTRSANGRHHLFSFANEGVTVSTAFDADPLSQRTRFSYEHPWVSEVDGRRLFTRTIQSGGHTRRLRLVTPNDLATTDVQLMNVETANCSISAMKCDMKGGPLWVSVQTPLSPKLKVELTIEAGIPILSFPNERGIGFVCYSRAADWTLEGLASATAGIVAREQTAFSEGGVSTSHIRPPTRPVLASAGTRSDNDSSYVIDTITIPYDNPYRALFFCSGIDFLAREHVAKWAGKIGPDVAVVCTVHGDVWLVDGVDDSLQKLRWKRYASGLYQPMGIKVIGSKIFVLERGQLTVLSDNRKDGVAEYRRSFCGDWHIGGGEHSYHTSLETDLEGNFYFHAGGDTNTPTGGTLIKVLADGSRSMVYSTGFRHPIGLGSLPDGRITGADQEGNWMPSTRIDIYKPGGFYGDKRAHHRDAEPLTYDEPLCWLPRQMDGSAGGQVFVGRDDFGPLGGHLLHMSYGNCTLMSLLMQQHAGIEQAGAVDLGLKFLAGVQRGRFRESDGCLYLAGMDGWQTAAQADGCLQRVRYTGQPVAMPTAMSLENGGIKLQFSQRISQDVADAASISEAAADPERYHVELWNYLWSKEYGSKRYSVEHPGQEGQDVLTVESATILDPWTVFLKVPGLRPTMQAQVEYDLLAYADDSGKGQQLKGTIYSTIHTTGPAVELHDGERIALVGGTLIEREQRYGYWEHAITAAHPDKSLTFRNLGWSGDTVWTDSRGIFDPADKGYARLIEQVQELKPTLFVLNYGGNEAWESLEMVRSAEPREAAIEKFIAQYGKLIDDLKRAAVGKPDANGDVFMPLGGGARFVLLTPLPMEVGVGPNADPSRYNDHLAKYTAAIESLARERGLPCINLADLYTWYESQPVVRDDHLPLTDNGLHLSEYGYWRTADWLRERLCAGTSDATLSLPTAEDAIPLISRLDGKTGRVAIAPLPPEQLQIETPILEFHGEFSALPLPALGPHVAAAPSQRYSMQSPGTYRMDVDGQPAARGPAAAWAEGLPYTTGPDATQSRDLLQVIRRKNELYFHRWRPQNITYLFLFRAHEQGNNAVEIPQFDPLIAAEEARIAELKVPQRHRYRLVREAD